MVVVVEGVVASVVVVVTQPQSLFAAARKPRSIAQFRYRHRFEKVIHIDCTGCDRRIFFAS